MTNTINLTDKGNSMSPEKQQKIQTHVKVIASTTLDEQIKKELEIPDPEPKKAQAILGDTNGTSE